MESRELVSPRTKVLIKSGCVFEHTAQGVHVTGIPTTNALIENGGGLKHTAHVSHISGVPLAEIIIKCRYKKHVAEICQVGDV